MKRHGDEGYMSPPQRLNKIRVNDEFFERNFFDEAELRESLLDLVLENDIPDRQMEFVVALVAALDGSHPKIKVDYNRLIAGELTGLMKERRKSGLTISVAEFIDMKVADGEKQEAAIASAIGKFGVSRREAFRMLKTRRAERIEMRETLLADWDCWYDNYEIQEDGTLVPKIPKA